jgi:formate dehydrogenase alpha subunit
MTNTVKEIGAADFILAIGTNTTETHPVIALQVKQALKRGATLAVIDPRRTGIAEMAKYHMQLNSGTDIAVFNGMANVIIAEDLYNKEFVASRTENFDAVKEAVASYTPEYVETLTGVPADYIREVARGYATTDKSTVIYTMGLTQHSSGTDNVFALANLALLCGHIGKESSGLNPLRGQNNVQGACDMGALPVVFTGYQPVASEEARAKFAAAWNVEIPDQAGLTIGDMMNGAADGTVKAMYILGENPVLSDPDANHVVHALGHLDLLVVQDIFLTETAQLADVVFPAACFAEKEGVFANTERRVQRVRKAVDPPGEAKADWEIIAAVANAMGYPMNYGSAAEVFDEIASLTPSYGGLSHARLEKGGLQWPCPTPDHPGTPFLHKDKFVRGLGKFTPVPFAPPAEVPDEEYPFVLNTGRRYYHYHTGTMTLRTNALELQFSDDYLEINPVDAERLGVVDGDRVKVTSRRGFIELAAKVTDVVTPGQVFTSFHFPSIPVNKLTNTVRCPIARIPELKVCSVKVENV